MPACAASTQPSATASRPGTEKQGHVRKEAGSAQRAADAEKALATLKQEARALRVAVRSQNMKKVVASTQTERVEGPQLSCQTEWQAVHMPLPCLPHGGTWVQGGERVMLPKSFARPT